MILLSTPLLIYGIFIITKCINSYIILTASLGDFKLIAKDIIHGNLGNIFGKIITVSNEETKDTSNDKSDYLDDLNVNLRRSLKQNYETEESEDDGMIQEANQYVIEQLGKHIKERVIDQLVSKFLRNKFNFERTENTQKHIRNTAKKQFKKPNVRLYKNNKRSEETSRENRLQIKRWPGKNYAKNFNNEAKEVLLKQKIPAIKPTPNPNEIQKQKYTINKNIKNKQGKGNEIYVILQPKVDSKERNNRNTQNKPTTTTRKFRFIMKTRNEHITERNKPKITTRKSSTSEIIYEMLKLNTNKEKVQTQQGKRIKGKMNLKEQDSEVKAITSYLWVDGEEDDIELEKVKDNSKEISTMKFKNERLQTIPYTEVSATIIDKYNFSEPIPEKDRVREVVKTIRKPPSRINKKQIAI